MVIRRLLLGNSFVYIERDEWGDPLNLWLAECGGYDEITGTIPSPGREWCALQGERTGATCLHFANTFRYQNGFWGMSTIQYAADTLSLIRTESNQAETRKGWSRETDHR